MTEFNYQIKELCFKRDGLNIYGRLYLPDKASCPLVINSHGFSGNLSRGVAYAEMFAENGIASYIYDFIGGGPEIHSDGKMTDMSVLTEAADLATVLDGLKELPQIDKKNIFLMGRSQGGYVSTYVGTKRKDEIRGMVLLYPAYVIQDDVIERTDNGKHIAKEPVFLDYRVGEIYDRDALAVDIYEGMPEFKGKVLLIHGTADPLVPYAYSLKAREIFPNAELVTIPGAGHGFEGEDLEAVKKLVLDFVQENIV